MSALVEVVREGAWLPLWAGYALKGTVILLISAAATALLWRASAALRHMVWCIGICGVLALPALSAVVPAWRVPLLPGEPARTSSLMTSSSAPLPMLEGTAMLSQEDGAPAPGGEPESLQAAPGAEETPTRAWLPKLLAALLVGGVGIGLLWLAAGFWGVARLGRSSEVVQDPDWLRAAHEASERIGLRRPVLLVRTPDAMMPATWGLLWPTVVLPAVAEQWTADRRRAVLAHELAHVKRFDCLTQAVAQVVCILFWWNPVVWYAVRRLRVERERACDDLVLGAGTRASDYASHLLEIARSHRALRLSAPALVSMAKPSQLESRLLSVLDGARPRSVPSFGAVAVATIAGLLVVGPLAAMHPTQRAAEPAAAQAEPAGTRVGPNAEREAAQGRGSVQQLQTEQNVVHAPPPSPEAPSVASVARGASAVPRPPRPGSAADTIDRPALERLIEARAVGVDAEYIRGMRDAGFDAASLDELVEMRAVGVTPAYVREMNAAGFGKLSSERLVELRAVGVTPAYAREMRDAGFRGLTADQLVDLRALGVSPAYLAEMSRIGYGSLPLDEVTGMKAVGVTPAYAEEMNRAGFGRLSAEQLTSLRALGVTPAFLAEMGRSGLDDLSLDEIMGLRAVGVSGGYIAELRAAGLRSLDAETATSLRAVGVSPEYIRELAGAGLTGLSADDLIQLRAHGITAEYIREMSEMGFGNLTAERLVRLRGAGVRR